MLEILGHMYQETYFKYAILSTEYYKDSHHSVDSVSLLF